MRKIRIGNDIRLKLTIKPHNAPEFSGINDFDQSNVKQLRCYLINTSFCNCQKGKKCCKKPCCQKIGFPDFYQPTSYNINNCGIPHYHMAPANMCNYHFFSPDFNDYHWWPGYRGFGIYPEHFHDCCHHPHWHGTKPSRYYHGHRCEPPHFCGVGPCSPERFQCGLPLHSPDPMMPDPWVFGDPLFPDHIPADLFGKHEVLLNHPHCYEPFYLADSWVLNEKNTLQCFFPAVQQKMCGEYKLVVVLTVFEQGWGRHNLRTYTIDKGDVFELVDDSTGESGNITIDVDDSGNTECVFDSMYTEYDNYIVATNSKTPIGGLDLEDHEYNIYVVLKDGSTVLFNPYQWPFGQLLFSSSDESTLVVGKDGSLQAQDWDDKDADGNIITYKDVDVTVRDITDSVSFTFQVRVKKIDVIRIGFDDESSVDVVDPQDANFNDYSVKNISYKVVNPSREQYLWVFSQRRIHYIKSIEPERDIVSELSSGIRVPMMNAEIKKHGYFCYRSVAPILAGEMNIKIKFA